MNSKPVFRVLLAFAVIFTLSLTGCDKVRKVIKKKHNPYDGHSHAHIHCGKVHSHAHRHTKTHWHRHPRGQVRAARYYSECRKKVDRKRRFRRKNDD